MDGNDTDVPGRLALATIGGLPSRAAVVKLWNCLREVSTVAQERNPPDVAGRRPPAIDGR